MSRVIAVLACGFALSACSSVSWMPSMPSMNWTGSGGQQISLNVESDPPGADARTTSGLACKTPCSLPVQATGDLAVNFSLDGYLPQSVPVRFVAPEDPRFGSEYSAARFDPNPVFAVLDKAPPPPPPPKKRPARKRTPVASAPSSATPAPTPPPVAPTAMQPASASTAPWPMPR